MAQSNVNMSKLKRSFQMLAAKIPQRTICEQLHMGRGVLNRYKTLADSQGLSYGVIGRMSDEGCRLGLYPVIQRLGICQGYRYSAIVISITLE